MKHLLNNLTEEEKNSIRGQHTGGMNVVTENFSKLINTKSGDVRTYLGEQTVTTGQVNEKNVGDCLSAMKTVIINMMNTIVTESKKQKLVSAPTEEEWKEAQKRLLRQL
jgi:hypothetical protein